MQISQFFVNGDIKGAIAYLSNHEKFKGILFAYVAIFEDQKYRTYEISDNLNTILRFLGKRMDITALISGGTRFQLSTASNCQKQRQNIWSTF